MRARRAVAGGRGAARAGHSAAVRYALAYVGRAGDLFGSLPLSALLSAGWLRVSWTASVARGVLALAVYAAGLPLIFIVAALDG